EAGDVAPISGALHQSHQRPVARDVEAGLADPVQLERSQRVAELSQRFLIAGDVVVDEEDEPAILRLDLAQYVIDGAHEMLLVEVLADRAEAAGEATAAHVLHQ